MRPDICIYHFPCADGFTAAWAIRTRWPDIEFVPGVYGQEPPDVTGKYGLSQIGRFFGDRHHSTVIAALETHNARSAKERAA